MDPIRLRSGDAQSVQLQPNAELGKANSPIEDLPGSLQEGGAKKAPIYQEKGTHSENNLPSKRLRPTAEHWRPSPAFPSNDANTSSMLGLSILSQKQRLRPTAAIFTPSQMKNFIFDAFPKSEANESAWERRYFQTSGSASSSRTKNLRPAAVEFVPANPAAFQPRSTTFTFAFPSAGVLQGSEYHHHAFATSRFVQHEPNSCHGSPAFDYEVTQAKLENYALPLIRGSSTSGEFRIRATAPPFVPSDFCSSISSSPAFPSSRALSAIPLATATKVRATAAVFVPASAVPIGSVSPATPSGITSSGMRPVVHSMHDADLSASAIVTNNDDQRICDPGIHEREVSKLGDSGSSTNAQILGQTRDSTRTSPGTSPNSADIRPLSEANTPPSKSHQSRLNISHIEVKKIVIQDETDELVSGETGLLENTINTFRRKASPMPSVGLGSTVDLSASIRKVSKCVILPPWLISNDLTVPSE